MDRLNKKETVKIIKDSTNFQSTIEYDNNSFTMNTKGDLMPKQENKVSLDSIYKLMITKFDAIETEIKDIKTEIKDIKTEIKDIKFENNKRFDSLETEIKDIKTEIKDMKININKINEDINLIKSLPTITKELDHSNK